MLYNLFQGSIGFEPFRCSFRTDFWHSGYVVGGIPDQSQVVNDMFRDYPKFLFYPGNIEVLILHCVNQTDLVIDDLGQVFVTGRHQGL